MTALTGRTVLVTGANRGLGREFVEQLLGRGVAKVYAAARNPATIADEDPRVVAMQLDVTDPDSIAQATDVVHDVDVVVNNAGISTPTPVLSGGHHESASGAGGEPVRPARGHLSLRRSAC